MRYVAFLLIFMPVVLLAQGNFDPAAYAQFLQDNVDMTAQELVERYQPSSPWYSSRSDAFAVADFAYLDSVQIKYELTNDEMEKLRRNRFLVSERLSYDCFGRALHDIYRKDLPVFITSDAILYALHFSYDRILFDLEKSLLEKKLHRVLDALYKNYPKLLAQYTVHTSLIEGLKDVDLYITMAKSLLDEKQASPQFADAAALDALWQAVQSEQMAAMPLFSERDRYLDFSQFTVRGHYSDEFWDENGKRTLGNYFKAMMWLGRMDFYLTPPPDFEKPWTQEEIQRMLAGALLLNELLDMSGANNELQEIDEVITFMVGESDNLTPQELAGVVRNMGLSPLDVYDDIIYDRLQHELLSQVNYGQRIMSAFFMVDPFAPTPDPLPVSFRLLGQRFILDSYILANVVYDRIIYRDEKIWRPMPDPLDAMFVLGADNALPLLQQELEEYKYASQLAALRYLADAYGEDFWGESLYNVWLQGIRSLNTNELSGNLPWFMKTVAWQQQKLNTQLASWTQLRHDNLLYAKQSYTAGTSCSYPHSFVEPYPALYRQIALFADKAEQVLLPLIDAATWEGSELTLYFPKLREVMQKLQALAQKELDGQPFDDAEKEWLKRMLFIDGMSGAPPFSGWYSDLFYRLEQSPEHQYEGDDYLVADVHTQPTDEFGALVGNVLHVGVGKVNLGVFLADSPSDNWAPMAYVGAVMSYYEEITSNFDRLTDERWAEKVTGGNLPARPDWVNVYLLDEKGSARAQGRELPGVTYSGTGVDEAPTPQNFVLLRSYPNPFNPATQIVWSLAEAGHVRLSIYDVRGREIATLIDGYQPAGNHSAHWDAVNQPAGLYFARLNAEGRIKTIKLLLVK